jgi:hypothetical protein
MELPEGSSDPQEAKTIKEISNETRDLIFIKSNVGLNFDCNSTQILVSMLFKSME